MNSIFSVPSDSVIAESNTALEMMRTIDEQGTWTWMDGNPNRGQGEWQAADA